METIKAKLLTLDDFVAEHKKRPILLTVQPTHFALLTDPSDLRKWEAMLKERIGESSYSLSSETATESADLSENGQHPNTADPDSV
jgi:hypothetical protein